MKRFLSVFFIISLLLVLFIVPVMLTAQSEITNAGIEDAATGVFTVFNGVKEQGWKYFLNHWYTTLVTLMVIGFIITRITPNKEDDAFFNKWFLRPFRLLAKIMTLGIAKNYGTPEIK